MDKKTLVVVSDGGDNASEATLDAVLERARVSNAAIYTIGIYDYGHMDKNPGVLKSLAHTTGGERYLPRTLGELRKSYHKKLSEVLRGEISKDLTGHAVHDIEKTIAAA